MFCQPDQFLIYFKEGLQADYSIYWMNKAYIIDLLTIYYIFFTIYDK